MPASRRLWCWRHIESRGYNFAASRVGALGLMQLRPATAEARRTGGRWRGHATLFDPVANVRLGVSYLERLVQRVMATCRRPFSEA